MKANPVDRDESSWVLSLPDKISQCLLGSYLLISQWNPCDATSVMSGSSLALIAMGLGLGFCTAAARLLDTKNNRDTPGVWRVLVVLFCGWLAICEVVAIYRGGNGQVAWLGFWQTIAIVGVCGACMRHISDSNRASSILRWMIGLAAGTSSYALYQYFYSMPRMREAFREDPTPFLRSEGIEAGSAMAMQFYNRIMSTEPIGPFSLTNSLAGFLAPWLVVLMFFTAKITFQSIPVQSAASSKKGKSVFLVVASVCVAMLGVALLLTKSRTAWAATAAGIGLLLFVFRATLLQRKSYWLAGSALLVFLAAVGFVVWRDPFIVSEAGKSLAYRADYWRGALELMARSPLFGYGSLNFQSVYPTVKSITASETPADPHNMWMEVGVDAGIPGLCLVFCMGIYLSYCVVRGDREKQNETHSTGNSLSGPWIDVGFTVASLGVLLMSLVFSADLDTMVSCLLFVAIAWVVAYALRTDYWTSMLNRNLMNAGMLIAAVFGLNLCFAGGWMQPGVMNTFVLAIAIVISSVRQRAIGTEKDKKQILAIALLAWAIVSIGFGYMTYTPEIRLAQWETEQQFAGSAEMDPEAATEALSLHQLSPEVADRVMELSGTRIVDSAVGDGTRKAWLEVYENAQREFILRDRNHWISFDRSVEWDLRLAEFLEHRDTERSRKLMSRAKENADEALQRFPSSIPLQLQSAVLAASEGNWKQAAERVDAVEKIDKTTPHEDRKLKLASVRIPKFVTFLGTFSENERVAGSPILVRGEPAFLRLRSLPQLSE